MTKTMTYFIAKCLLLILAQAVIFNNIVLFNVAIAFVFLYAIVSMPLTWSTNASLTIGFLIGLAINIFSDTPGINTIACTVAAFVRKPVFHLYEQNEEDLNGQKPSQRSMGTPDFLKYLLTMALIYCLMAFTLDSFAFFNPLRLVACIVASTIFTFIVIYAIDTISTQQK